LSPQPGDPKRSELDRYLFLENLLSAQKHVYFSYVGQSNRQDGDFPSSVIVREFLDYLARFYGINPETLLTKHPLQAFSSKYFKNDKKLFSYSSQQKEISSQLEKGTHPHFFMASDLPEPDEEYKFLTVNELISFFQHPAKFTLQNRLGIYITEDNVLTEDREPFVLKGLEGYNVGHELFKRYLKQESMEAFQPIAQARDLLPAGWSGERAYRNTMREVESVGQSIRSALDQSQLEAREVNLTFGDFRLLGKLDDIFEEELIRYRFGSCRPKDLIGWWITHLIFQLVKPEGHSGYSKYISKDSSRKRAEEQTLAPVADAKEQLQKLLDLYWQGLQREICFYPETSLVFAEKMLNKNKSEEQAVSSASKCWIKDSKYNTGLGDGEDPYNKLMISNEDTLKSDVFQQNAVTVWQPFLKAKKQ
jgi:exodeoxyribonuclease V gamma subunit